MSSVRGPPADREANVDEVIERMVLRVVMNTLEPDWSSNALLEDVRGAVEIEILPTCILQPEIMEEVVPLMADEAVADRLDGAIVVEFWKVERKGDRFFL